MFQIVSRSNPDFEVSIQEKGATVKKSVKLELSGCTIFDSNNSSANNNKNEKS